MKRVLCGALAVILAIGCLTGCQKSNEKKFETLSVTFEDGKTVSTDMDQETVRKNMADPPYNTLELQDSTTDEWTIDYGLYVDYRNDKVDAIFIASEPNKTYSTSIGVSYGDSVASLKEKLGNPTEISEESTDYQYGFILEEGRYTLFNGTLEDFFQQGLADQQGVSFYMVSFKSENDKINSFSVYKLV